MTRVLIIFTLTVLGYLVVNSSGSKSINTASAVTMQQINEYKVYKEKKSQKIYLIIDGKKVLIPTTESLIGSGYTESEILTVDDELLSQYPVYEITSDSRTPGSLMFPAQGSRVPLYGINKSQRFRSRGKDVILSELRGWIINQSGNDAGCNKGDNFDFSYGFVLDTDWAVQNGIDIHKLIRAGNIVMLSQGESEEYKSPLLKLTTEPIIKVELNSWGWGNFEGSVYPLLDINTPPSGWLSGFVGVNDSIHGKIQKDCDPKTFWPFHPLDTNKPLPSGQYVKIWGSLIADGGHFESRGFESKEIGNFDLTELCEAYVSELLLRQSLFGIPVSKDDLLAGDEPIFGKIPPACSKNAFEWNLAGRAINKDLNNVYHSGRWSEIHPPDKIIKLEPKVTTTNVAALFMVALESLGCKTVKYTLRPKGPKPPGGIIGYDKSNGSETRLNGNSFERVTVNPDSLLIEARVCPKINIFNIFGGSKSVESSILKSIYRVWWVNENCNNITEPTSLNWDNTINNSRVVTIRPSNGGPTSGSPLPLPSNGTNTLNIGFTTFIDQNCIPTYRDYSIPEISKVTVLVNDTQMYLSMNKTKYNYNIDIVNNTPIYLNIETYDLESGIRNIELDWDEPCPGRSSQCNTNFNTRYSMDYSCRSRGGSEITPVLMFDIPDSIDINGYQNILAKHDGKHPNKMVAKLKITPRIPESCEGQGFIRARITNGKGQISTSGTLVYNIK